MTKAHIPFRMEEMKAGFFFSGIAALCSAGFLFLSCASSRNSGEQVPYVHITDSKKLNLLPPEYMEGIQDGLQLFEGTFGGHSFTLPVFFHADKGGIFMQILNDFGTGIASISYNGEVSFESAVFPEQFKAEYIIADIQLAFYSFSKVKESLEEISLGFSEETILAETGTVHTVRTVSSGKKAVQIFDRTDGRSINVRNILRGYSYTLTGASDE